MRTMIEKPKNLELVSSSHPFKVYSKAFIVANFHKISQRQIAKILNIGKTTANQWARSMNLVFRKDTVNEIFFHKWSTIMAYVFGYICADGNVAWDNQKGYYCLTITAAEKDKLHLEKIRRTIESSKPLLYGKSTKSYRLVVNSQKICLRLMRLGVMPRKSLILKFPKVPNKYLKDFIRGYVDGDGSLRFFNRKRSPYFELMICSGSKEFLTTLGKKINGELEITSKMFNIGKHCYILRYSCSRGLKLANWLYQDAKIFIARKYNKYQEALSPRKE